MRCCIGIRVGGERREPPGAVPARAGRQPFALRLLLEHPSGHHASEARRLPRDYQDTSQRASRQRAPAALPVAQPAPGALLLRADQVEHREARDEAPRHLHALLPLGLVGGQCRTRFPAHALVHFAVAELARHAPCGHVLADTRPHRLGGGGCPADAHAPVAHTANAKMLFSPSILAARILIDMRIVLAINKWMLKGNTSRLTAKQPASQQSSFIKYPVSTRTLTAA